MSPCIMCDASEHLHLQRYKKYLLMKLLVQHDTTIFLNEYFNEAQYYYLLKSRGNYYTEQNNAALVYKDKFRAIRIAILNPETKSLSWRWRQRFKTKIATSFNFII